ncbi:MAG: DNA repair protein RecN [Firmicutes bacterium]|nr:DNA repair protein RecN [Bacillota bacterium]
MLRELSIENFALIDKLTISLSSGLNILSGETGAGKSIIIDALNQVVGARASSELVRSGAERAVVTAQFDSSEIVGELLAANGLDSGDETVILQREVYAGGKSQARINGRPVNLAQLREVSAVLVEIHGQHEHQTLLNPAAHLAILDSFGGQELLCLRQEYHSLWQELRTLQTELASLHGDEFERERTLDLLQYQINEIQQAELEADEEDKLLAERKLLLNARQLLELCEQGYSNLYQGEELQPAVVQILGALVEGLKRFDGLDGSLDQAAGQLEESLYTIEESARQLRQFVDGFDFDPQRLEELEQRLDLINDLKRKYGGSVEAVLNWLEQKTAEIEAIRASEQRHGQLVTEIKEVSRNAGIAAGKLSACRRRVAVDLAQKIVAELSYLQMKNSRFEVQFDCTESETGIPVDAKNLQATETGVDQVEFMIAPNPGEPLKPLAKIASGGEMSRIMLAILNILATAQPVQTIVFDEVDAGIGGRAAQAVAEKLASVSIQRQVLCVSHLPQVASMADSHYYIMKEAAAGRTQTMVRRLDQEGRVEELARMLGGAEVTPATLRHAREMLGLAGKIKAKSV